MSITLKVYDNGDHTCLVWLPDDQKPIKDCRGFTIRRLKGGQENFLHGFVGFSDSDKLDPNAQWKFPLQRYMWWDYGVTPGDVVQYSVVPVVGPDKDHLQLATGDASALTPAMTVTGQATPHVSAFFNKGIVAAQWVSRALAAVGKNAKIAGLIAKPGDQLRNALSGLLRPQILAMLDDAKTKGVDVFAALYELNDPELLDRIKALGKKCHLILANGAFDPKKKPDENKAVRDALRPIVDLHDRLVPNGHFAHNKFLVVCDTAGKPQRVLSGSTNWTMTGLCTQANNGVIVEDPDLAADFLAEWNLLKDAGNAYPPSLAQTNSTAKTFAIDGGQITQWFAPTDGGVDLTFARKLINAAQQGILFLFFNPGGFVAGDDPTKWTLLQSVLFRHHDDNPNFNANLYIRGVVNQEIANLTSPGTEPKKTTATKHAKLAASSPPDAEPPAQLTTPSPVILFSGGNKPPVPISHDAMVPGNIKSTFHDWETELLGSGVHVHSKVVILDPFGADPVVMTGSHNLGFKASSKNDDNLMIIQGNAPLAASFAANIIAVYQAYRWNSYVEAHRQDPKVWHGLVDNDEWQTGYLQGDELAEIKFWLGTAPAAGAGGPAAPPHAVNTVTATGPAPKPAKKNGPKQKASTKKVAKKKAPRKSPPRRRHRRNARRGGDAAAPAGPEHIICRAAASGHAGRCAALIHTRP
jgi:phosphatidylserine/phosphatidylglycerophosphate/cardiolipin synthase-like enzyme